MYSFGGEIGSKHAFGVEERSHVRLMFYLATVATSLYTYNTVATLYNNRINFPLFTAKSK